MTAALAALAVVALLAGALRSAHRQRPYPRPPLYGRTDDADRDRDAARVRAELRHAALRGADAVQDLQAALTEFAAIAESLGGEAPVVEAEIIDGETA